MDDAEETKAPAKKAQPQARKVDHKFDAEMKDVGHGGEDDIDLEDTYHQVEIIESIAAIDYEVDYLTKLAKTIKDKDERDFYNDKVDSLKFKKQTIETNVDNGYVTPESYTDGVKAYLTQLEKTYKAANTKLGRTNKHVQRMEARLKAVMGELKEMQDGLANQQP